jgi:phosphate transport system substrate-binding protein
MRFQSALYVVALLAAMATIPAGAFGQVRIDEKLPAYKPVPGVSGNIKSVGSDTMNNLMTLWLEGFRKYYPSVQFEVEGKGTSTAPPALIAGTATFGAMSRPMKPAEIDAFEKRYGYKPVGLGTSIDMLAVFVNKDNPLTGISFPKLDAIFSSTRKMGHPSDIRTWGQAGLDKDWADMPISMYGRNAASGTYGYFKENVLGDGDYKNEVKEQPGSGAVIQGLAKDKAGIGYSGIGYRTADVRPLALAVDENSPRVEAVEENGYSGKYPLSRFLLVYLNYRPGTQLDPLRREFVKFIFSREGQEAVNKEKYLPVTAPMARRALEQVGLKPSF